MRDWLRRRQPAQNVAEFSLIVAAVAVVGMLGLQAVTSVQKVYFGDVATVLNPPAAAVPGDVLHTVDIGTTCTPVAASVPLTLLVGTTTTCTVVVTDIHAGPSTPQGTVKTNVSSGPPPSDCSPLLAISQAASSCFFTFTPTVSQMGPLTLQASYSPKNSNHLGQQQTLQVTVVGIPNLTVNCTNDLKTTVLPNSVEVGHPLDCLAKLTVPGQGGGISGQLSWSLVSGAPGTFACSVTTTQGCSPTSGQASTATCTTDSNGACRIIFRPGLTVGTDTLQIDYGGGQFLATSKQLGIQVMPAMGLHQTTLTVDSCPPHQKDGNTWVHCTVTITDSDPLPTSPAPTADVADHSPPGGTVIVTGIFAQVQYNTCTALTPFVPDHSTCTFDLVEGDGDSDSAQFLLVYDGGDALHQATSLGPLPVTFP